MSVMRPYQEDRIFSTPARPDMRIERVRRRTRWVATAALLAMPGTAFVIPFIGALLSFVGRRSRSRSARSSQSRATLSVSAIAITWESGSVPARPTSERSSASLERCGQVSVS